MIEEDDLGFTQNIFCTIHSMKGQLYSRILAVGCAVGTLSFGVGMVFMAFLHLKAGLFR